MDNERVDPIRITIKATGETYILDFTRETVSLMDRQGFAMNDDVMEYPNTKVPNLFWYALRANHSTISKDKADAIRKTIGGVTPNMITRLFELYYQAIASNNVIQSDEELEKNVAVAVEM